LGVNWYAEEAETLFCGKFLGLCENMLQAFADADPSVDNMDYFNHFMADFPAGSPFQDLAYFAQNTIADDFMQFDYGRIENKRRYGQPTPPRVPLENFDIPVALI